MSAQVDESELQHKENIPLEKKMSQKHCPSAMKMCYDAFRCLNNSMNRTVFGAEESFLQILSFILKNIGIIRIIIFWVNGAFSIQ